MHEHDEDFYRRSEEVLKHEPICGETCENSYGYIPLPFLAMLIRDGRAEEYQEDGVTFFRAKEEAGSKM